VTNPPGGVCDGKINHISGEPCFALTKPSLRRSSLEGAKVEHSPPFISLVHGSAGCWFTERSYGGVGPAEGKDAV
jgi:hypothetical protein